MDIVPAADFLVVEGKVSPQYIDRLTPGMLADVHFDAYASRMAQPVVQGKLAVVSADALSDARTGSTFYTIRVAVPDQEVRKLGQMHMHPGMVATVMIKTGERSLLAYVLRPLSKRLSTALTEH
jgi:multidrug efflux pump subunit AcrA (membrane-fusion protein)